jgi:hypothetical protein
MKPIPYALRGLLELFESKWSLAKGKHVFTRKCGKHTFIEVCDVF